MKKIVALLLVAGMVQTSFAAFDDNSFRMQGINPDLTGILVDEYTNARSVNVADVLNINGFRFYTQFANLSGKGDRMFDDNGVTGQGGTVNNDDFQFGMFGHPFQNRFMPESQMGFFYEQGSSITAGNPGAFANWNDGEATNDQIINTDNSATADNDFIDTGDTTLSTRRYGKREIESLSSDLTFFYAQPLGVFTNTKLGIGIQRDLDSTEEPINGSYARSWNVVGTGADTETNTLSAEEKTDTNTMTLNIGARTDVSDRWKAGASLILSPQTEERKRTSVMTRSMDVTNNLGGGNTSTLTASGTDISEITTALTNVGGLSGIFNTNDSLTLTSGGFNWTNGQALINDGYMDPDAAGKIKRDGMGKTIRFDSYYIYDKNVTLYGALAIQNTPLDLDLSATNHVSASVVNWNGAGADQTVAINNQRTYSGSGDDKTNGMTITLGAEQNLPSKVKLAYGVIYQKAKNKVTCDYTETISNQVSVDATGDGLQVGAADPAGDSRVTTTQTNKISGKTEMDWTTYSFPIGFELKPHKKVKLRLGVTHTVTELVTKVHAKTTEDGLTTTVTEAGGSAAVTTYGGGASNTGDTLDSDTKTTTKTRTTQYYYGAGFRWSKNLSIDILNFSGDGSGAGILDLASWRVGMTLLFGPKKR